MDIDTALTMFLEMAPKIFPVENMMSKSLVARITKVVKGQPRFDPRPLEQIIKIMTTKYSRDGTHSLLQFRPKQSRSNSCKVYASSVACF